MKTTLYKCKCQPGYQQKTNELTNNNECQDVDECESGPFDPCKTNDLNMICRNTVGSFECDCPFGFAKTNFVEFNRCLDINECENADQCDSDKVCFNFSGGFQCKCPDDASLNSESGFCECDSGFSTIKRGNGTKLTCSDINECDSNVCGPNEACKNEIGGYKCDCEPGFEYSITEKMCADINECEKNSETDDLCDPDKICKNLVGSFSCECPAGLILDDENVCLDINECLSFPCLGTDISCKNVFGSYECQCDPGFKNINKNGSSFGFEVNTKSTVCADIDECTDGFREMSFIKQNIHFSGPKRQFSSFFC